MTRSFCRADSSLRRGRLFLPWSALFLEFRETLFWSLADHVGSTTALSYERSLSPTLALRWLNAATITQRSKEFDWSSDLGLVKDFGHGRQGSVEGLVNGLTGSGVAVREWGLQTRWQQPLHRSWLHGELIVGRFWARPDAATPREAVKQQRPLLDLLAAHPEINKHLDRAALARMCDPANYLGQSGVMVDRVLASL